jgi:hypothetical protein
MQRIKNVVGIAIISLSAACGSGGGPDKSSEDAAGQVWDRGNNPAPDGATVQDRSRADAGPARCAPACGSKQICDNGTCKDLPDQCPCPLESYCNLATNQCVPGCASDEDCQLGRYCDDQRKCQNGCRVGKCGTNEECQPATRTCECTSGHHRCSGRCVPEGISSCGPSCQVCPTDPHGTASCTSSGCSLSCKSGTKMCGSACAACPTGNATTFTCSGSKCIAAQCSSTYHVCSGSCVLENIASCGSSCGACSDAVQGACSSGACYNVVDFGYYPSTTTCAARCASQGKSCGDVCNIKYTRPNGGTPYQQIAGGHYTQSAAYQPWGYLKCTDTTPGGSPTSVRCCCTEKLTGTPKPGCTQHSDCGSSEFCWAQWNECYPTTDSRCPPGYTYRGQCSNGTQHCSHSGLPSGTTFLFNQECPAGTTQRGSFYCSGETKVCVPN